MHSWLLLLPVCIKTLESTIQSSHAPIDLQPGLNLPLEKGSPIISKEKVVVVSSCCLQREQMLSDKASLSLSFVFSLQSTANHRMKLWRGIDHCSQITWHHWKGTLLNLKCSCALAEKYPKLFCKHWSILTTSTMPL